MVKEKTELVQEYSHTASNLEAIDTVHHWLCHPRSILIGSSYKTKGWKLSNQQYKEVLMDGERR
jgi:hypothetical protein